jgi:hypothetical protein
MIMWDIFDHSGNNTQIVAQKETNNPASESQTSTSSRVIVQFSKNDVGLAASAILGGADALPEHPLPVLLLRANDLRFAARRAADRTSA